MRVAADKRRRKLADLTRKIAQEQTRLDTERYAAIGRAVEADLGLTTAEEWQEWWASHDVPTSHRYAPHANGHAGVV